VAGCWTRQGAGLLAAALLGGGCWLEKTTGQPVPLDPRFYQAVEDAQGAPGVGGGDAVPFASHDGPMVTIRGTITSPQDGSVDVDVRTPDPKAPGGVKGHGKLLVDRPGPFELAVPADLGKVELQAFQDPDANGPGGEDPFAQVILEIEDEDVDGVLFELEPGARGTAGGPEHHEAPPGAPGGDPSQAPPRPPDAGPGPGGGEGGGEPQPGAPGEPPPEGTPPPDGGPAPGGGAGPSPFSGMPGDRVTVAGQLLLPEGMPLPADGPDKIDVDLFQPDEDSPGGRRMLGKLKLAPGDFSFEAPEGFGTLLLEAFFDANGNQRPDAGDAMGRAPEPLRIGSSDLDGVRIELVVSADGRMPGDPEKPPPPGGRQGL
jgi:hypothetical protein